MKRALIAVAAICCLLLMAGTAAAIPSIQSFYARDEGGKIALKVRWCVPSEEVGDNVITTFRMWREADNALVLKRVVRGRANQGCAIDSIRRADGFANGTYSANAAVSNVTRGEYTRIGVRYFTIS